MLIFIRMDIIVLYLYYFVIEGKENERLFFVRNDGYA